MATANLLLEDQISCSVCCNIYRQPHLLNTCLHTFCLDCIHQLEKQGRITCPECREIAHKKDIRSDFKTQGVIDAFRAQNEDSVQNVDSTLCGMCQDEKNQVKFHCKECEYFLCSQCHVLHQRSQVCKSHTFKSVAEMMKGSESVLKNLVNDFEKHVVRVEMTLRDVSSNITEVNTQNLQQLKDVDKYTQDAMEELKRNQQRIKKLIKDANANLIKHPNMQKETLTKGRQELQDKIAFINDLIKSKDVVTLTEITPSVKENMMETLKQIKSSLPDFCSTVHVTRGENWDVKGCIDVKIDDITQIGTIVKPLLEMRYSKLHRSKYREDNLTKLLFGPQMLKEINGQIWCCGGNKIYIYNQQCQQVKQITLDNIGSIHSWSQTHNNDIIVASESGLHLIDISGQYKTQVANGRFSDVCIYYNYIYALEYHKTKVTVFKHKNGKWESMTDIQLSYSHGNTWDKMCVCQSGIYVNSHWNTCLYIYSLKGQLQPQIQSIHGLILCGMDEDRNVLAVGWPNNKIVVCGGASDWPDITIVEDIKGAMSALLDHSGDLWIACTGSMFGKKLTKYNLICN